MSTTLDPAEEQEFKTLQLEGKRLAAEGKLTASLKKFMLAAKICPTSKVYQRIEKLKAHMKAVGLEIPNDDSVASISSKSSTASSQSSVEASGDKSKVLNDIQNLEKSKSVSKLTPQNEIEFNRLKEKAKELSYEGRYEEALVYFKNALLIYNCPKVLRYINEVKKALDESCMENSKRQSSTAEEKISYSSPNSVFKSRTDSQVSNIELSKNQSLSTEGKYSDSTSSATDVFMTNVTESNSIASDNEAIQKVKQFYYEAKDYAQEGKLEEALRILKKAQDVKPTAKVQKQIDIIKNLIKTSDAPDDEEHDEENKLAQVKNLYYEAREMAAAKNLKNALKLLNKAQSIKETARVQKQIDRIEELLAEERSESEGDEMIKLCDDFAVFHEIYKKLYPYQREGVAWMWNLFKMKKGGVLGDDMGLGKTFQVIAFLSGMIDAEHINHVLVIMPVSLITIWEREFKKWCPGIFVLSYHGTSKKERERNLLKVQRRGHVLLTSYGMLVSNVDSLTHVEGQRFIWDYVILDEGHKIKNPTKTTKAVHDISSKNRLVLTGTPVQNNLRELWSLYDFTHHGTLLGTLKTFKMQYENPITRAREKDATAGEKRLGTEMSDNLKSLIQPFFLRRTKEEIWVKKDEVDELGNQMEGLKLTSRKNDFIVWTYMTEPQIELYTSFLHSDAVKSILVSKRSPLVELTILKKICDHPRLLSKRACLQLGLNGELQEEELLQELDDEANMASSIENIPDETLLHESGKMDIVLKLLHRLRDEGHKTLVFSLSRKILDMLHRILVNRKWKVLRLDGTISKMEERAIRIQRFQRDPSISVFLITTQVGGVGITLTAADRVIIYDPSWNPATDAQAVDRVYRIGQQKNVIIYRLITCGTVEEKIYRRQVFKDSIFRQTTGASSDPYRYFSKQELRELFALDNPKHSATQVQLSEMHSSARNTDEELENHVKYLETLNIFGVSDHDLMFSRQIQDHTEDNDQNAVSHEYIKKQVAMANELIQREASVVAEGLRIAGDFHRPYQETIPLSRKLILKDNYKPPVIPEVIDLTEDAQHFKAQLAATKAGVITIDEPDYMEEEHGKNEKVSFIPKASRPSEKKEDSALDDKIQQYHSFSDSIRKIKSEEKDKVAEISSNSINQMAGDNIVSENVTIKDHIEQSDVSSNCDKMYGAEGIPAENFREACDGTMKFGDASHFLGNPLLQDISLDEDIHNQSVKMKRKSCARKSALIVSDSESSNQGSCPSSLNTHNLVAESDESDSDSGDSSNSDSVSYIPDSIPSTPLSSGANRQFHPDRIGRIPMRSNHSPSVGKQSDSVGGITPLKVSRNVSNFDSPFAKAVAASPILTPKNSPDASMTVASDDSKADTPIKYSRKKKNVIQSDSEDSDKEKFINDNRQHTVSRLSDDSCTDDQENVTYRNKENATLSKSYSEESQNENNDNSVEHSSRSLADSYLTDDESPVKTVKKSSFIESDCEISSDGEDDELNMHASSPVADVSHEASMSTPNHRKSRSVESESEDEMDVDRAAKRLLSPPTSNVSITYTKSPIKKRQRPNSVQVESDDEVEDNDQDVEGASVHNTEDVNCKENSQTLFSEDESEESEISDNQSISDDSEDSYTSE